MRFHAGQVVSAEWDGDGTWRVITVLVVDGDDLEVRVHPERLPGPPAAGALSRLGLDLGERHEVSWDELASLAPIPIATAPERVEPPRSTRRGLLRDLMRRGIDRAP
jgi:hypothetical protein